MHSLIKKISNKLLHPVLTELKRLESGVEANRILLVQPRIREFNQMGYLEKLSDAEFKVFSQWGEDGIIQYLLSKVSIENKIFVEFGVGDYLESNTRFLLVNNNWQGLVIEGNSRAVARIRRMDLYWRHDLTALHAFITRDNINDLIQGSGISGDIGLLSIDIDGNDYWIWEAITVISPRILVIEYNSIFGHRDSVSIPYDEEFSRTAAHHSNFYFGASLAAFCNLAKKKGYVFAGSNSHGTNAFFVRKDVAENIADLNCEDGYVINKVRDSRDQEGNLTFKSKADILNMISDLDVISIEQNKRIKIRDLSL